LPLSASILAIGDEIVSGITVDSNSAFLADALRAIGIETVGGFSVADDENALVRALGRALTDADVVLTTGGLGPTADDLTTAVVAKVAGRELSSDEESLRRIEERFRSRNIPMPANNAKQALIPEGATIVPNPTGTAPGFICPLNRPGPVRHIICLPGVPSEMRRMAMETVLPWLRERAGAQRFGSRVFSTFGLSESRLDELLAGAIDPAEARLSFRAAFPRMQTRVVVSGSDEREIEARLDRLEARVRERLGRAVYAIGDEGMEETVVRLLTEQGRTLAVAESCTGGLIGSRITDVAGSSRVFLLGVIAYANEAKVRQLAVPETTLAEHGAVSVATAEAMARGIREAAGADLGVATTGIAGPGGGTPEKPVGTVCVALAWEGGRWSKRYDLGTRERDWVKRMTAQIALDRIRRWGLGEVEDPD
jgi:nicotinamide-nucleotide amidase